ncbi:MAG: hypothetical protein VX299_09605, partial [Pseudomonadota bacterium]|nr:hypothetical protein [Pseudomonadota bacterium]
MLSPSRQNCLCLRHRAWRFQRDDKALEWGVTSGRSGPSTIHKGTMRKVSALLLAAERRAISGLA